MPVTPILQLMLDLALILELNPLRKALAQVEYAKTKSPEEDRLLFICEDYDVPKPDETDTHIRDLGYLVIRYAPDQLRDNPEGVAAEIAQHLAIRTAMSA
jgi:hypothetical protein